jgi:hypothetical protein
MEKFILLCHWNGRFGNRMHQYAYGATFQNINKDFQFWLPSNWEGSRLFKNQVHKLCPNDDLRLHINQSTPEYDNLKFRGHAMRKFYPDAKYINVDDPNENYKNFSHSIYFDSVCAYHGSVFSKMEKKYLLDIFEFNDNVKKLDIYKRYEDVQGTYNIAHLRRDDISNIDYNKSNIQGYSVVSMDSYYRAFEKFGYNKNEILWISDDYIKKWHKERDNSKIRAGWTYPIGSNYVKGIIFDWLEDFLKLYFARTIFRANSSFSWWAAFLSPTAKVYSPVLDKQIIYGRDAVQEIEVDFIEGNSPHWMYDRSDILIN